MLGSTMYLLKDVFFDLADLSVFKTVIYFGVFFTTAILLARFKVAPQWVVLGTFVLGTILAQLPTNF
jgi:hypothetical protein